MIKNKFESSLKFCLSKKSTRKSATHPSRFVSVPPHPTLPTAAPCGTSSAFSRRHRVPGSAGRRCHPPPPRPFRFTSTELSSGSSVKDGTKWRFLIWKHGKTMGKPWESHEKTMGKPSENHGKTMGKPWENHGKTMGKPWENHGKTEGLGNRGKMIG